MSTRVSDMFPQFVRGRPEPEWLHLGTDFRKICFAGRAKRAFRRASLVSEVPTLKMQHSMPTHRETPRVSGRNGSTEAPVTTQGGPSGFQIGHRGRALRSPFISRPGVFRFAGALALSAMLGATAACGGSEPTPPTADPECVVPSVTDFRDSTSARVVIKNFAFQPASITIKAGQTVKWKHCGPEVDQHTVTSTSGTLLESPYISKGGTFSKTFDVAATNPYYCIPHSADMNGTIIVEP
jgi:plastocyanin